MRRAGREWRSSLCGTLQLVRCEHIRRPAAVPAARTTRGRAGASLDRLVQSSAPSLRTRFVLSRGMSLLCTRNAFMRRAHTSARAAREGRGWLQSASGGRMAGSVQRLILASVRRPLPPPPSPPRAPPSVIYFDPDAADPPSSSLPDGTRAAHGHAIYLRVCSPRDVTTALPKGATDQAGNRGTFNIPLRLG